MPSDLFHDLVRLLPAEALAELQAKHGGHRHYLPRGRRAARVDRNRQIRDLFKGSNFAELARAFDLSERQVRRICCPKKVTSRGPAVSEPAA